MNTFDKILGRRILKIQRLDSKEDYEFTSPYAIIISLEGLSEKLIISATSDGSIGKIYFCLEGCRMTDARPFCPAMKFGMLSSTGFERITTLINSKDNWE